MKNKFRLLAMALLAGAVFSACGDDDNGGNDGPDDKDGYPPVEITNEVKGAVKAGTASAIEILGTGFLPDLDYIYIGYDKDGKTEYEQVKENVLTMTATRISFGVHVSAPYLDKTVKVYLDRPDYKRMPITGDITFTMPSVAEGYIPDAGFRGTLSSTHDQQGNPAIAPLFDTYGMLDVQGASKITSLNLYASSANSLEGIELFTNVTFVSGWDMPNIKEIDLSKWTARGVDFRCERAANLEKLVGAPYGRILICHSCPKLTHVDVHLSNWMHWLNISDYESKGADAPQSAVTYLDLRRNQSGEFSSNPTEDNQFTIWGGNSGLKVADNATILVDSWFIFDHNYGNGACWDNIYDAWKNHGATIKVYSRVEPYTDELLGTVPMASEDPDALSPSSHQAGKPTNKWQVEDPHTDYIEAPALQ